MKLQNLAVLFVIIILPISLILSVYIENQVETLRLQILYDTKLDNATSDALKAFQLNTVNSSTSDLSNSKMRDIEASVNSFFNSIASNFNMDGYNRDILKEYVPALVYTMYDGYYIYSSYTNTLTEDDYTEGDETEGIEASTYQNGEKLSGLKSYVYYSCRYKLSNSDFVITYSLDNYITIKGWINGRVVDDAGYLINDCSGNGVDRASYRGIDIITENLKETLITADNFSEFNFNGNTDSRFKFNYTKVNGVKYYKDDSSGSWFSLLNGEKYIQGQNFKENNNAAVKYYSDAEDFKRRILYTYKLGELKAKDAVDERGNYLSDKFGNYKIFNFDEDGVSIEDSNSDFNQHRLEVIRYSIEKNLSTAIANYNQYSDSTNNFQMPELKETDWDKILNNISIISFLQGLNIGGKVYNGYSIINNTKNEEVVNENSIYIVTNDGQYHKPTCDDLKDENILGAVFNIDLERKTFTSNMGTKKYFFPQYYLGCYSCIVNQTKVNTTDNLYEYMTGEGGNLAKAYFTALGRERYSMYKTNNNSSELIAEFSEP